MSRSGYTDDCENLWLYRRAVENAIRGKRGQRFLRDLLAALDAMPEKRLIADALVDDTGAVCALGALGRARGIDVANLDPYENFGKTLAATFDIAWSLACEVQWMNDEVIDATPEGRWTKMRAWVVEQIRDAEGR